ncbi:beta-Ala-His dipeptidase [Paenisporosarcina indica]|uniref:beta-Ala-His dipeptidase n=1 Tax=Paenisporosarcina indica TaxID=650093 RepID=UPI0009FE1174|nr:beta-Ala-His dipeptidase [Paenisporosarcina indica]
MIRPAIWFFQKKQFHLINNTIQMCGGIEMERVLSGLHPENVFYFFEEISRIPRCSGNEQAISDYLVAFAKERRLKVKRDAALNVVIDKPASPGYEDRPKVILQGHMDMVCVKNLGVEHDFEKDPIELVIDGEFLRANGTSLGADDGNAIAICLAILDNDEIVHPALEVVFTTGEEVGMQGVMAMDVTMLDGDYWISLDYSQDSDVLVSSAGSSNNYFTVKTAKKAIGHPKSKKALCIRIDSLTSGHSGIEIIKGRANANRILGEILSKLENIAPIELAEISGGTKNNVIPAAAQATICCETEVAEQLKQVTEDLVKQLKLEYCETDPIMNVECVFCEMPEYAYSKVVTKTVVTLLNLVPNGLQNYLDVSRTFTKSSANLGVVYETEQGVEMQSMTRSNSEYEHDQILRRMEQLAELCGVEYRCEGRIPVWEYDPNSSLARQVQDIWERLRGTRPETNIIHAGVETGLIIGKMREQGRMLQAINVGVRNYDVHTPRERMEITSLGRTYELIIGILKEIQ